MDRNKHTHAIIVEPPDYTNSSMAKRQLRASRRRRTVAAEPKAQQEEETAAPKAAAAASSKVTTTAATTPSEPTVAPARKDEKAVADAVAAGPRADVGDDRTMSTIRSERRTFFQRLLRPECIDADISTSEEEDEDEEEGERPLARAGGTTADDDEYGDGFDDGTVRSGGSATLYSSSDGGESGSVVEHGRGPGSRGTRTTGCSSRTSSRASTASTDRNSDSSSTIFFEKGLEARHRGACRSMRVS